MKIRTLALTAIAFSSAAAFAMSPSSADPTIKLADVVEQLEALYPGEVTAIQLDASGDKPAHYHVDMRFPASGLARVDVDALTFALSSHDSEPLAVGSPTLAETVAWVASQLPGRVTAAQLDSTYDVPPHYDIDVRLPDGNVARVKLDPQTRQIAWRNPAIVAE
jgi:uncharacterized membrane protein YkoI